MDIQKQNKKRIYSKKRCLSNRFLSDSTLNRNTKKKTIPASKQNKNNTSLNFFPRKKVVERGRTDGQSWCLNGKYFIRCLKIFVIIFLNLIYFLITLVD